MQSQIEINLVEAMSLLVAAIALISAIWSSYNARRHNRLSVRPLLRRRYQFTNLGERVGVSITNLGLGPAIIDHCHLKKGERTFPNTHAGWAEPLRDSDLNLKSWNITMLKSGSVIVPGESIWIYQANEMTQLSIAIDVFAELAVSIEYKSLYQERQVPILRKLVPRWGSENDGC